MGRFSKLLSLLPILIPLWLIGGLVHSVWPSLVVMAALLTAANAATVWMLRYQPELLVEPAKFPAIRQYISLICRFTGEQFPVGHAKGDSFEGLALRSKEDFEAAIVESKSWVRGQSTAIEKYLRHVRDTAILRQKLIAKRDDRPLQTFLLCGPSGIGKRYLARVLGRLIFLDGEEQVWDLSKIGNDPVTALFGSRNAPGPLLSSLARQPFQTIILENVELATGLQDILRNIMQQGAMRDPATGRTISFRNAILVMTTTQCSKELSQLASRQLVDTEWHLEAIDLLSTGTGLAANLLTCVNEFIPLEEVSLTTKAEVVALALSRECHRYGVQLEFVAPEILVQEIGQLTDAEGFALLEDRTKKLLQRPLLEAAHCKARRMALRAKPILSFAK